MTARAKSFGFLTIFLLAESYACQVPVFRYALERWRPDPYEVFVIHDGNLTIEQVKNLTYFEESLVGPNGPMINLRMETIDLSRENDSVERWRKVHDKAKTSVSMHLFYPYKSLDAASSPIWSGRFEKKHIDAIIDSPARRQIVERILAGDSSVWVLLQSGDKKEDDKLLNILNGYAKLAEKEISVPEGVIQRSALDEDEHSLSPEEQENLLDSSVPLKIAFSITRLSRDDPNEEILRSMLLNLEDDLLDANYSNKAMLFPVFGKGRVLPPLVDAGINEENVMADCGYLCGPCSCQVKNQNPGMDLLVKADWLAILEGNSVIVEKELPPLTGVEDLITSDKNNSDLNVSTEKTTDDGNTSVENRLETLTSEDEPLSKTLIIGVALVSAVLLIGTFVLNKNKER